MVAGVGSTWYTWLEQGRDVRASVEVLEAIAGALQLSEAERDHLLLLGRGRAVPGTPPPESASPALRRLVDGLDPNPAMVLGRRSDILCWNRAYSVLLRDPGELPEGERNLVWLMFTDPVYRERVLDFERSARHILARFRASRAANVGDPAFDELIAALAEASPEFRAWWPAHEVRGSGEGTKILNGPGGRRLVFEHAAFNHSESTTQRLVLYTPDAATRAWLEERLDRAG